MNNFVTSLIRTWSPVVVGVIVTYFARKGFTFDDQFSTNLLLAIQGLLSGLYYLVVRLLEKKFPQVGVLLGVAAKPKY